jgi:Cu-Zn family superoxide dismutase
MGEPEAWLDFNGTALQYDKGPNLNGIAKTPNDETLLVVQMNKGLLFKIDVASKAITSIDLGGELLTGGDGLELDGQTLYVVRQPEAEIVTIQLAPGFASGKATMRFKHPALQWPATAVKVGRELIVVNSQFNKRTTNDVITPFSVIAIPLARLNRT